ncbi:MAG: DUF262 domain-containing protein [Candidatus Poseidoniales archaeon]|nr:MAG: DUF262 domain-containing protein [Candidatus Poseidoniales archaeon]
MLWTTGTTVANLYTFDDIRALDYATNDDFTAPFYQRTDSRWKQPKRFNLAVSMALGLPAGMITTHDLGTGHHSGKKHHIVDGRQRKAAINVLLNVSKFAGEIQSIFTGKNAKSKTPVKWKDEIHSHVSNWFSKASQPEREAEAQAIWDDIAAVTSAANIKKAFRDEYANIGIILKSNSKKKLIQEAANLATQRTLNHAQHKNLEPLAEFAVALAGKPGHSPLDELSTTFTKTMDYRDWNPTASATANQPFFMENKAKHRMPVPNLDKLFDELKNWVHRHTKLSNTLQFEDFVTYLGKDPANNIDSKHAIKHINSNPSLKTYLDSVTSKYVDLYNAVADAKLGWCRLSEKATGPEAMKVFELINDQGAGMKEFELMASWPTWVEEVVPVAQKTSTTWKNVWLKVDIHYKDKGTEPRPAHLGLTKWDLIAVLPKQIDSTLIWGGS